MMDRARKQLVLDIKRELISLPADELFRIAKVIGSTPRHGTSELDLEDSRVCFDHIIAFMCSELLLETEDQGMSELLSLQEMELSTNLKGAPSFNNVCRQIDSGLKENFNKADVVRGVLRIIKPGIFKDMLMNKDDMTEAGLKGFLQSHFEYQNSTELFQELMCTNQSEHETPQQFQYRVMGLKQKILFAAKQADPDRRYSAATVQKVLLYTVYQGLSHWYKDIRSELKPL
ncbi:uncharacterized protein LOC102083148 [Tachysurus ichikawai]